MISGFDRPAILPCPPHKQQGWPQALFRLAANLVHLPCDYTDRRLPVFTSHSSKLEWIAASHVRLVAAVGTKADRHQGQLVQPRLAAVGVSFRPA